MQLIFIRHGQSANNKLWDDTGASVGRSDDPRLTPVGVLQATLTGRALAASASTLGGPDGRMLNVDGFQLTHLYCSMHHRTLHTASLIAAETGLDPVAWHDIHEESGIFLTNTNGEEVGRPGLTRSQIATDFPRVRVPDWLDERGWWQSRPRETLPEAMARARGAWADLLIKHGDSNDRVGWVSHGAFGAFLLRALVNLPDDIPFWHSLNNCSLTRIDRHLFRGTMQTAVRFQNRVAHLPAALIT